MKIELLGGPLDGKFIEAPRGYQPLKLSDLYGSRPEGVAIYTVDRAAGVAVFTDETPPSPQR